MRGRKPKPAALRKVEGNPGKRKIKREPKPPSAIPDPPARLSKEALAEWKRVAPALGAMGLLTVVDRAALAGYCEAYARWRREESIVAKEGTVVETMKGNTIQNPHLGVANTALKMCHKFAVEFGFTPSSRSRLSIEPPEGQGAAPGYIQPTPRAP